MAALKIAQQGWFSQDLGVLTLVEGVSAMEIVKFSAIYFIISAKFFHTSIGG